MAIKISGTEVIDDNRNITTSIGTVDGRDVATDGTKLDGIETGATADQTKADIDALNINADLLDGQHGAYYTGYTDTAVSNLVDSSPATLNTLNELAAALGDDVNFSTTVTDSIATKLPLTGGAMTGAITTNSTFDGRDVATDGTKLDGIEAGAKADQVGLVKGADIGGSVDLNTYTTNGYFHQNLNGSAGSGTNYPAALAGMLSVQADGSIVYQKYQTFNGGGTYQRTKHDTNWFAWDKILDTGNAVAFTSADNTKLDGIEAGADVTDATNVIAAGALMKTGGTMTGNLNASTTLNARDIRAYGGQQFVINAGESHSVATGQTSEFVYINAEAGLQVNSSPNNWSSGWGGRKTATICDSSGNSSFPGNVTLTGTVDGRNVATDGTKLDGIETGANVTDATNVSAAGALMLSGGTMTGQMTVSNSGPVVKLNDTTAGADDFSIHANNNTFYVLVDRDDSGGHETPHPLTLSTLTNNGHLFGSEILTTGNAVAFTSADNTKLDGIETGATADQTITLSGDATGSGTGSIVVTVADDSHNHVWGNIDGASANSWGGLRNSTQHGYIDLGPANTTWAHIYTDRPNFYFNKGVSFQGNLTLTGTVDGRDVAADGTKLDGIETGAKADQIGLVKGADIGAGANLNTYTTNGYFHQNGTTNAESGTNYPAAIAGMLSVQADGSMVYQKYQTYNGGGAYQRTKYVNSWYAWDKILDTGNAVAFTSADNTKLDGIETGATADQTAAQLLAKIKTVDVNGSGGINAGRLDGHVLTTAATANTVVERNGSGDINARLFRSSYSNTNANTVYFMTQVNQGNDNYLRPSTLAQVRTKVVAGATAGSVGSYAYMIVTSANISVGVGSTRAGSGLRYSGQSTNSNSSSSGYNVGHTYSSAGGTWRAMGGRSQAGTYTYFATLWLRIS